MCGFSKLVASEVTQPLWPSSVPRMTNCSPMLGELLDESLSTLSRWVQRVQVQVLGVGIRL